MLWGVGYITKVKVSLEDTEPHKSGVICAVHPEEGVRHPDC